MSKRRLVVVGNGMGGARFVEELVSRGGRHLFEIAIYGDEPHGAYNRILLSSVLAGHHQPSDIVTNPPAWYAEHGIALHAGVAVEAIDTARQNRALVRRRRSAVRRPRVRDGEPAVSAADRRHRARARVPAPGRLRPDPRTGQARQARHRDRRRAARPRSRAWIVQSRHRRARRPSRPAPDGGAARRGGRRGAAAAVDRARHSRIDVAGDDGHSHRRRSRDRRGLQRRQRARLRLRRGRRRRSSRRRPRAPGRPGGLSRDRRRRSPRVFRRRRRVRDRRLRRASRPGARASSPPRGNRHGFSPNG